MSTLPGTTGRRRIYLMRHGHVDYFSPAAAQDARAVVLTAQGRMEAGAAGRAFCGVQFDRAICSGLPRTRETAEIVLSCALNPPALEIAPDFEEIHAGRAPRASRAELVATLAFQFACAGDDGATLYDGGEAFARAQARAIAALQRLLGAPHWKQILIVAHEGINRILLSWVAGAGLRATHAFEQDTGCINMIDFDMVPGEDDSPGPEIARALIKAVNLTPYNYIKHGMNLTSVEAIFAADERASS
jgi:probable phosphoglycerate mutase